MELRINKKLNIPAYVQLKTQFRLALRDGELEPGKLAGLRKMASSAGVSRGTMARVMRELAGEGLFEVKARSGIYLRGERGDLRPKILLIEKNNQSQSYLTTLLHTGSNRIERFAYSRYEKICFHEDVLTDLAVRMLVRQHPAVLVIDAAWVSQEMVYKLLDLPFPVCFVGDFSFGELCDPRLNQVREDTAERGRILIQVACDVGCRDICICGAFQSWSYRYYIDILRAGVAREAADRQVKVRYESVFYSDMLPEAQRLYAIRQNVAAMVATGLPDGIIADNHIIYSEIRDAFREYGVELGRDLKFIAPLRLLDDSDVIDDGYLIRYNYCKVGDRIEQIIRRLLSDPHGHIGSITTTGLVSYQLIHVQNIRQHDSTPEQNRGKFNGGKLPVLNGFAPQYYQK